MRDKHADKGGFIFADCAAAVALERMERMDSVDPAAGPPLICHMHVQGLGRCHGVIQAKAVPPKAVPPKAISLKAVPPISELNHKVLII